MVFANVTISPRVLSWGFTSEKFRQGKRADCAPPIQSGFGGSVGSRTGLPLPCLVRKKSVTSTSADAASLLWHRIGAGEHRLRLGEVERPGGLEVDYQLKCRRLPHG